MPAYGIRKFLLEKQDSADLLCRKFIGRGLKGESRQRPKTTDADHAPSTKRQVLIPVLLFGLVMLAGTAHAAPFAYIPNSASSNVSVIDTATNTVVATVAVESGPEGVAVNPAGTRVYVTNADSNTVSVIDTATNTVVATVAVGARPLGVAVNPACTPRAYVTNANSNTVSVIDTATNTVVATVAVGARPIGVAVNPAGTFAYVANIFGNTISVIDTATNTVVATVAVINGPEVVAVNPAGTRAYVTHEGANTVSVIDTATNTVVATVAVGTHPRTGVAVNPAGTRVYVTNTDSNTVSVIDTATNTVVATVAVGTHPRGAAVNPAGTRTYVANKDSDNVSVIDTATNTVVATVAVGTNPIASGLFIGGVTGAQGKNCVNLAINAGGANSVSTMRGSGLKVGYATVTGSFSKSAREEVSGGNVPYGTAVFSLTQNDVVVTEAGVPASPPTTHASIFIDFRTGVTGKSNESDAGTTSTNTGFAVVNMGSGTAHVTYTLRDKNVNPLAIGSGTIASKVHAAKFIDQLADLAPNFVLPANFSTAIQFATLEIQSDQPLSILALRLTTNQRGDTLLTSTPIADLTRALNSLVLYFPQLVDGGGYITFIILLNTSNTTETGTLNIFGDNGSPLAVHQVGGVTASSFPYSIPAGSFLVFQTDGSPVNVAVGSVQVIPDPNSSTPVGAGVFRFTQAGIVVTESGIPSATPTTHARINVDKSGGHDTGVAIAAPTDSPLLVTMNAFLRDGVTAVGFDRGVGGVNGNGHLAKFAGEVVGGLPDGFTGVLDLSSSSPFVALTLRSLNNSRGDFLLTTFPIADFNLGAPFPIVFPQIVDGGGYQTQFILLSAGGAAVNTTLSFFGDDGSALGVGKTAPRE